MLQSVMKTKDSMVLTILRLVLGVVFFAHGLQKVGVIPGFGYAGYMGFFGSLGIPSVFGNLAIAAELLGGLGLIVGLLSRVAAAGIVVDMIVAVFLVHLPNGLFANWGQQLGPDGKTALGEGYEFHLLAIAMALAILIEGAGSLSADGAIAGK